MFNRNASAVIHSFHMSYQTIYRWYQLLGNVIYKKANNIKMKILHMELLKKYQELQKTQKTQV